MKLSRYNKTIVGIIGFMLNLLYIYNAARPDARITAAIGLFTVLGIYQIPNWSENNVASK